MNLGVQNTNVNKTFLTNASQIALAGADGLSAINLGLQNGELLQLKNGLLKTLSDARTQIGYVANSTINNLVASATVAGAYISSAVFSLAEVGVWTLVVMVGSALGITIGTRTYTWIKNEHPEWLTELEQDLAEWGWAEFDVAVAENGLTYLPTAVIELVRGWFEKHEFFDSVTIERQQSIDAPFTVVPENFLNVSDAFSGIIETSGDYDGASYLVNYQTVVDCYQKFYETVGYPIPDDAYVTVRYGSGVGRQGPDRFHFAVVENIKNFTAVTTGAGASDNGYFREADTVGGVFYINFKDEGGFITGIDLVKSQDNSSWIVGNVDRSAFRGDYVNIYATNAYNVLSPVRNSSAANAVYKYQDNLGSVIQTIPGVSITPGAVTPVIGQSLDSMYPNWTANKVVVDNTIESVDFLPVAIPKVDPTVTDVTIPQVDAQTGIIADTDYAIGFIDIAFQLASKYLASVLDKFIPKIPTANIGAIPLDETISEDPDGMYTIYSPTKDELNQLSSYLWTGDVGSYFKKMLVNPFDVIIGLYKIYATPIVSPVKEDVNFAWVSSGIDCYRVVEKFIEIDCGEITPWLYFGNVLDYQPYSTAKIYLPFIGIVPLDINHIINRKVKLIYKLDVSTGSCIANIYCDEQLMYSFNGNCAVQIPITGSDFNNITSSLVGLGLNVAALVATKKYAGKLSSMPINSRNRGAIMSAQYNTQMTMQNATAGIIQGAGGVSSGLKTNVTQSGNFSSNYGELNYKKPFLIIERPVPYEADNYKDYYGIPSNTYVKLNELKGFTRVKEVHLDNILASEDEKNLIDNILKGGIII